MLILTLSNITNFSMKHETKHIDHQRREDEVANFWSNWMSEIPTKLEKNGQQLLSRTPWRRRSPSSVKWLAQPRGGGRCADI